MGLFSFLKKKQPKEEKEKITLTFAELKQNIKQSVKKINEIDDKEILSPLFEKISALKESLKQLKDKKLDFLNEELKEEGEALRIEFIKKLIPLINVKQPSTILKTNKLIKELEEKLEIDVDDHFKIIFREEYNKINDLLTEISYEIEELKSAISERNEQIESFKKLIKEARALNEALKKVEELREKEMSIRKNISMYERDKLFMSKELNAIKEIETYNLLQNINRRLKWIKNKKIELENKTQNIVKKFAKKFKEYFDDEKTKEFLENPLKFICENEAFFNKRMNEFSKKIEGLKEPEKSVILKAISDDSINDYINEYKELIESEKKLSSKDFSLLKKARAFEKRIMELNTLINNALKELDEVKAEIKDQLIEVNAIKSKVEVAASECYPHIIKIIL